MTSTHRFTQLDVFTDRALLGNALAVVHGADGLSDARMAAFARWTNLSETTFLLAPTEPGADYRVRIFTPRHELPFASHLTLGSCQAWLEAGSEAQFEVRAFIPSDAVDEDPVTGSLNAGLAQWLICAGLASPRYVAAQGTALGRAGRVFVEHDGTDVWIGGHVSACIEGMVRL